MNMDDCSKPYRLIPINSHKFLHVGTPDDGEEFLPVMEFRLNGGMPETVPEFSALFEAKEERVIIIIWIGDCFVYTRGTNTDYVKLPADYLHEIHWNVTAKVYGVYHQLLDLSICGMTTQGVMDCVGNIFGLSMSKFNGSVAELRYSVEGERNASEETPSIPCEVLEKFIIQNEKGICCFSNMAFTPSQCRTIATTGKKTHLRFERCMFQDRGQAFTDAYMSSGFDNQESGPSKLDFDADWPLHQPSLLACVPKLKELSLPSDCMKTGPARAVVSAELDFLHLSGLLAPEAAQLIINNIREGRGPKGISVTPYAFFSREEQFTEFCHALSSQSQHQYLKTLELSFVDVTDNTDWHDVFLAAWRAGKLQLTKFALTNAIIQEDFWNSLLEQISLQPSLRKVDFTGLGINSTASPKEKTEQLLEVVQTNENIEQVEIDRFGTVHGFDQEVWLKRVVPAFEHNKHRELFEKIEKISDGDERKAVVAEALMVVNDRPSLLYALLHGSIDIIAQKCVFECLTRKRAGTCNGPPMVRKKSD